jgi:hypothetical protein
VAAGLRAQRSRTGAALGFTAVLIATIVLAHAAADTKTFENSEYRYSVMLPSGCRHDEGPGTLDAVCSAELDAEKSAQASAVSALVLEVAVERVPEDAGKTAAELGQLYNEAQFKAELPEAVCGEPERTRVKIENVKQLLEDGRVVYTADIGCPDIKFLGLAERRGAVQFVIAPGLRYRLMARAPKEEYEQQRSAVDAFFSSFRILP